MKQFKGVIVGLSIVTLGGILVILGLAIGFSINNEREFKLLELSYLGTVLAAIASLIGIVLLYLTYQSQKRELKATQEALRLQKTDSAFFNMLTLLQQLISTMTDTVRDNKAELVKLEGRAYLKNALFQLHEKYMKRARINMRPNSNTGEFNSFNPSISALFDEPQNEDEFPEIVNYSDSVLYNSLIEEIDKMYGEFYNEHQQNLGHYFRYVYNIIKYVIDPANRLNDEDRRRYLGILQAQLSNDELGLIFYNVLSKHGQTSGGEYRFLKWLDQYNMLENMDRQSLKEEWHHWFFPKTMFKFLDAKERERKKEYIVNLTKFNIPK